LHGFFITWRGGQRLSRPGASLSKDFLGIDLAHPGRARKTAPG
jgi:hypothetical protein